VAGFDVRFCTSCATELAPMLVEEDGGAKTRLRCPACGWTHWNNPTPVLAAVIELTDRDGRLLLARNAAWPGRFFGLITGFMEAGETPEEGIAREVREETALEPGPIALIGVYEFLRMNQVIVAYHVQASGEIRLSPELSEYRVLPPADVKCWPAGTGAAARQACDRGGRRLTPLDNHAMTAAAPAFDKELDTRGLNCPLPILKAKKALAELASGQVLRVVATDPGSMRDFQAFARQTGNELVGQTTAGDEFVHLLRRR
jgi:TusA-related sulfurtransferase